MTDNTIYIKDSVINLTGISFEELGLYPNEDVDIASYDGPPEKYKQILETEIMDDDVIEIFTDVLIDIIDYITEKELVSKLERSNINYHDKKDEIVDSLLEAGMLKIIIMPHIANGKLHRYINNVLDDMGYLRLYLFKAESISDFIRKQCVLHEVGTVQ